MADKQTIKVLEEFVQNIYWADFLSSEQSIKNLEESLVEVLYEDLQHKGNGLLITEDGYFLTANHVREEDGKDCSPAKYIRDYQNEIYPIKKICQTDEREDLALLKAEIKAEKYQKRYKICNTDKLKNFNMGEFPIQIKTRLNGKIEDKEGSLILNYVVCEKLNYTNQIGSDIQVRGGDSGGIIISSERRELIGFVSNGMEEGDFEFCSRGIMASYHSKIFSGLNLVVREINSLKGF